MKKATFPLHDAQIEKLDSIVKTIYANFFGHERFPDPYDRAAAFFCLIIKDHPVTDGNKRLAVYWLQEFSVMIGIKVDGRESLDVLAVSVEKEKHLTIENLIKNIKCVISPTKALENENSRELNEIRNRKDKNKERDISR